MKRKIWFKAKPTADEGLVYGYYRFVSFTSDGYLYEKHKIYDPQTRIEHDVEGETVCQFTGLTDKNGVEIYEGDKLQGSKIGIVVFEKGKFFIKYKNDSNFIPVLNMFEIIGNIHDKKNKNMDYSDLECPYCGAGLEVNHDDGEGYDEDTAHQKTCTECKKSFVFHTTIIYDYNAYKADCLNGGEHTWMLTKTYPREASQMCCTICDEHRELTESERKQHDIGMLAYFQTLQKGC